jgi:phenylalanyl-tRNA synthetase alpha subunit
LTIKEFAIEVNGFRNKPIEIKKFLKYFQKLCKMKNLNTIKNINFAYDLKKKSLNSLAKISQIRLNYVKYEEKSSKIKLYNNNKKKLENKLSQLKSEFKTEEKKLKGFTSIKELEKFDYENMNNVKILKAFVIFGDSETARTIRKELNEVKIT